MATRKRKLSLPSFSWLQRLKQRATSKGACFIWGALFGNAVLVQTLSPLDVLTRSPESLLSAPWRERIDGAREQVRHWGQSLSEQAEQLIRQHISEWLQTSSASAPTLPAAHAPAASPAAPSATGSAFAACIDQFPQRRALQPELLSPQWAPRALCSDGFAVLYSGRTKTPLVVVERLNRARLQQAAGLPRTDRFYADARVPSAERAQLSDYQGSGYDRGHLAAAANQHTESSMAQSFALTNMVPQDPTHNRKVWSKLEADTRKYAQRAAGDVFVYSGPLFDSNPKHIGAAQVWVPSHLFKLVYDAASQRAWAHILPNHAQVHITPPVDYATFVAHTQWNLLAGMPVANGLQ